MSDHADWPGLQQAIAATGAERVFVTHGQVDVMVRWLGEQGLQAQGFVTEYGNEDGEKETVKDADVPELKPEPTPKAEPA
jgi:putative mRNA 3-end processing factor